LITVKDKNKNGLLVAEVRNINKVKQSTSSQ